MRPSKKLRRLLRVAWLAGLGLLVLGSLLPGSAAPIAWLSRFSDKLLHFLAYAAVAALGVASARNRRAMLRSVLIVFFLSVALDCLQWFVPGRTFEVGDLVANMAGLSCGVLFIVWLAR